MWGTGSISVINNWLRLQGEITNHKAWEEYTLQKALNPDQECFHLQFDLKENLI